MANNQIKVFENTEFGEVRVVDVNGESYFVGKDVADILGYNKTADAIRAHVDEEDKGVYEMQTPRRKAEMRYHQ